MAIADDAVERVHEALAAMGPKTLVERLGVRGAEYQHREVRIPCPVHGGKDANCAVFVGDDKRIGFVCWSACGRKGGDGLDLVAATNGLDVGVNFAEVLRRAADVAGIDIEARDEGDKPFNRHEDARFRVRPPQTPDAERIAQREATLRRQRSVFAALFGLLELVGDALPYLARRGLRHPAHGYRVASGFGARCVIREETDRLLTKMRSKFDESTLVETGIVDAAGRFRFARHELLLPVHDEPDAGPVWFQGRAIGAVDKSKRWNSPRGIAAGLYNGAELRRRPGVPAVLCEGPIDTLSLLVFRDEISESFGDFVPVGKCGVGALKEDQAWALRSRRVSIAFDGDKAGHEGTVSAIESLQRHGHAGGIEALDVPPGKDVNDWVTELMRARYGRKSA